MKNFFDKLYGNVGVKLQVLAMVCGVLFLAAGALFILAELIGAGSYNGIFFVSGLLSAVLGVISTWSLYAFGQLVEDVHAIRTGGAGKAPVSDDLPDL